jgi:hypothetical protein
MRPGRKMVIHNLVMFYQELINKGVVSRNGSAFRRMIELENKIK